MNVICRGFRIASDEFADDVVVGIALSAKQVESMLGLVFDLNSTHLAQCAPTQWLQQPCVTIVNVVTIRHYNGLRNQYHYSNVPVKRPDLGRPSKEMGVKIGP